MFRVELYGWVTVCQQLFDLIGCTVKLGDDQVLYVLAILSKLSPNGFKFLTMAALGWIVLNKNVLFRVIHYVIPCLADDSSEAISGVCIRRFFGCKPGLNVSSFEVTDKPLDIRDCHVLHITIVEVLKLAFVWIQDTKRWHHELLNFHEIA